jgi:hypothetical protein
MPAFRSVQQSNHWAREEFLYELKAALRAAACGGRPRPACALAAGDRIRTSAPDGSRLTCGWSPAVAVLAGIRATGRPLRRGGSIFIGGLFVLWDKKCDACHQVVVYFKSPRVLAGI